jgi:DNA-directed RNA polymerase subunit K
MGLIWPKDKFTRFEVARLIGARALQVALGAPVFIKKKGGPIDLAKVEFKKGIIPITVKRKLPDDSFVAVNAKDAIRNWLGAHEGKI